MLSQLLFKVCTSFGAALETLVEGVRLNPSSFASNRPSNKQQGPSGTRIAPAFCETQSSESLGILVVRKLCLSCKLLTARAHPACQSARQGRDRMAGFRIRVALCAAWLGLCLPAPTLPAQTVYRNTDPLVAYVGSRTCESSGCHAETYRDYAATAHGANMAPAASPASLARVPGPVTVFNAKKNRYYTVYQQNGELYQSVYELDKKGNKTYDVAHKIDYVVGGELVGYSYLFHMGPWMLQAPLSYYARSKSWELSPGYVEDDLGFTRVATTGCLMCHNGQPDPLPLHDGSYKQPPFRFGEASIGCEACHGPGALHVAEMQSKKGSALAPGHIDTSIVNPAHLSPRLADDICKECHQQGDTQVLQPGKSVLDYRPGRPLGETIAKFKLPIKPEQRAEADRLEAGAPVRGSLEQSIEWKNSALEMSKCYQATHGQLTCGTCHSIHHEPRPGEEKAAYRAACLRCHTVKSCTLKAEDPKRIAAADYCVQCHMEKRAVAGVAHSNDTKHRIVRYLGQPLPEVAFEQPHADIPGLLWVNRPDSEAAAADGAKDRKPSEAIPDVVKLQAYFTAARKDPSLWPLWFRKLNELSRSDANDPVVLNSLGAVALAQKKDSAAAEGYFARALKEGSEDPTTFINLATSLEDLGLQQQAESVLERGVAAYPYSGPLTARLAQQFVVTGEPAKARKLVAQYRAEFPEEPFVREVEKHLNDGDEGQSAAPAHSR
jgi:hypothetical protein